jgi:hypothetical protein
VGQATKTPECLRPFAETQGIRAKKGKAVVLQDSGDSENINDDYAVICENCITNQAHRLLKKAMRFAFR